MQKYEFNALTNKFDIDPDHVAEGLAAARKQGHAAISIRPLDARDKGLSFDVTELSRQAWIKQLFLHSDLKPTWSEGAGLELMTGLEELTTVEWTPIDYSAFKHLKQLILVKGTTLRELEKVKSLEYLYLSNWQSEALPAETSLLAASELRVSASKKLRDISAAFEMKHLTALTLQFLPALKVPDKALRLDRLESLHVEKIGWTDFSQLHSKSLRDLELFGSFDSLGFIAQLPKLEKLYIWECADGDMRPVLSHPTLKHVYFDKNRKHYSHKEAELEAALLQKHK